MKIALYAYAALVALGVAGRTAKRGELLNRTTYLDGRELLVSNALNGSLVAALVLAARRLP